MKTFDEFNEQPKINESVNLSSMVKRDGDVLVKRFDNVLARYTSLSKKSGNKDSLYLAEMLTIIASLLIENE